MSIFSIFTLLGGLAFFIYGMNQMSHSLERIAGNKMEQFIKKMTKNRLSGPYHGLYYNYSHSEFFCCNGNACWIG